MTPQYLHLFKTPFAHFHSFIHINTVTCKILTDIKDCADNS